MIEALFSQPTYVASKKMLDATVLRHQAIASNLANLETPHYRRLDVAPSFAEELRRALKSSQVDAIQRVQPRLEVDPQAVANTRDGNTVQLESELAHLNENFVEHTLETQLITGMLLRLRLAITGRPI